MVESDPMPFPSLIISLPNRMTSVNHHATRPSKARPYPNPARPLLILQGSPIIPNRAAVQHPPKSAKKF